MGAIYDVLLGFALLLQYFLPLPRGEIYYNDPTLTRSLNLVSQYLGILVVRIWISGLLKRVNVGQSIRLVLQ
ncbi:hypothetical protein BDV24DRAFT_70284 [Aspergillus arachidicola]|uniref:Uncharacterized protein n=1 Tax=Aspergillus arachidicola TaxID=656916 RepID=A0A5N6Y3G4_9EURO|nr:hypothetical protein BDV24DRAFT_70284 [Aspergillus arachidicola]